jgi:hypothetical protein
VRRKSGRNSSKFRSFFLREILLVILAVFSVAAGRVAAEPKLHSTSTSRQFIVYGSDVRVRGALCDLAEKTKANLLNLLRLSDNWKTPLVVNLDYPQANLPEAPLSHFDFGQSGSGLKLQLNLLLTGDLNGRAIQRELLRAILIEMIYRSRTDIAAGSHYIAPADWLIDGILQLAPGRDSDEAAYLLQTLVANKKIEPLEDILKERRDLLEPPSRRVHDAYSMALVQLLRDSPDGPRRLAQYIEDLPEAPNDSLADLRVHFPSVLGHAATKWWVLSVARLSATDRYEMFSAPETARRLDLLLHFSIAGRDGKARDFLLSDYKTFLKLPAARASMEQLQQQLLLLGARAHPAYRDIVQEYSELVALLAHGKTRKVAPRLTRVASYRAVIDDQRHEIVDYMNWYEATQLKNMSGAFADVLRKASEAEAPPRRRDAISVYLDSIEAQLK